MRVLLMEEAKTGSLEVLEITDIGFDDDITGVKDKNGEYDRFKTRCVSGLDMIDTDGDYLYIAGISLATCNSICEGILEKGYYDLSRYGEYEYLDN